MSTLLKGIITGIILIFVGIMFVVGITPDFEASVDSANITNSTTSTLIDMSEWIIPVLAIVGLMLGGFALLKSQG